MPRAASAPAGRLFGPRGSALLAFGFACAMLGLFALGGPESPLGVIAIGLTLLAAAFVLPVDVRYVLVVMLGLSPLLGQTGRFSYHDTIALSLAALALGTTIVQKERAAWNIAWPGWFVLGSLTIPWLAVPGAVISFASFLGGIKLQASFAALFLSLRRLVPRERSHALLWLFPVLGTIGVLQLFAKTQGLGALLFARMSFRNFYTRLAWAVDFISAVLEFCICISIVLLFIHRRPWVRLALVIMIAMMIQGVLMLLSRAGILSLGFFALVLVVGLGGRRGWVAAGIAVLVGIAMLATPGGQATLGRFTDTHEQGSIVYRWITWSVGITRFLDHPWTGIGLQQGRYQHDLDLHEYSSNLFLDVFSQQGIFGGLLFVGILVALFRMAWRILPYGHEAAPRAIRVGVVATLVQVIAHGSVETTILGVPMAVLLMYLAAWLCLQDPHGFPAKETGT